MGMPKMSTDLCGNVIITKRGSRRNRALRYVWYTVHVWCSVMMQSVPMHRSTLGVHWIYHVDYHSVALAYLRSKISFFLFSFSISSLLYVLTCNNRREMCTFRWYLSTRRMFLFFLFLVFVSTKRCEEKVRRFYCSRRRYFFTYLILRRNLLTARQVSFFFQM